MEGTQITNAVINVMLSAYKPNSKCTKVISRFHESLMECQGNSTLYVKSKWEDELQEEITTEEWFDMCILQHTSTSSQQRRVFNWKNLVRFCITPKILSKRLSTPQPCWRQCGSLNAHHTHLFGVVKNLNHFGKLYTWYCLRCLDIIYQ